MTSSLNFERLKHYKQRFFVSSQADLRALDQIKPLFQSLLDRAIASPENLNEWLNDRCELEAALSQVGTILYIRMTCQTDDLSRAQAYQQFIETIQPAVKIFTDQLNHKFLVQQKRYNLDVQRLEVYSRGIQTDIDLFTPKNVPLQTEVDLLCQEYQTVIGAMTVNFESKEQTLPQVTKFLNEPNRDLRERAWRAIAVRRLDDKNKLEGLFDRLLFLRVTIAKNADCSGFCEYKFRSLHRFDYTAQDCKQYHQSIEELVVPLWQKILERRKHEMKLEILRPWDTSVDPSGKSALRPFSKTCDLIKGCQRIFQNLDSEMAKDFSKMIELGVLDLESRKGKAPGGYQSTLDEARIPFIFMNSVGVDDDVRTLLHESGHAFHALNCSHDPLLSYRHGPMEFNEVASMGMELLADGYLSTFYNPENEQRSRREHWEGIIFVLVWVAVIDAFQHWLYEYPNHNSDDRQKAWIKIYKRFGADLIDWQGLEQEHAFLWHRQLHVFEVPFYYIEYGIAQLGALQLWHNFKKDPIATLKKYKKALSLGGSRPLPELFQAAGICFDFSAKTIAPLMETVKGQLYL